VLVAVLQPICNVCVKYETFSVYSIKIYCATSKIILQVPWCFSSSLGVLYEHLYLMSVLVIVPERSDIVLASNSKMRK